MSGSGRQVPHVIAVVLNWRDAVSTRSCVESLLREEGVSSIVVVDNESTGELRTLVAPRVALVEEAENLGFSRGVNIGIREALTRGADAVLVINNDAIVEPRAVAELVNAWQARGSDAGIIAPIVRNPDGTVQSSGCKLRAFDATTSDNAGPAKANYLTWACVLVPRSTTDVVGLLDERFFMYWEDVDYGLRVRDAGLELVLAERASVVHEKSSSHSAAGVKIDQYGARGLVILARTRGGLLLFVGLPLRVLARVAKRILSGRPRHAVATLRGVVDGWRAA